MTPHPGQPEPPGRLLLVNQTVGPLFMGVVAAAARRGPVTLVLGQGSLPAPLPAAVRLRRGVPYRRRSALGRLLTWSAFSLQLAFTLLIERLWHGLPCPPAHRRRHDRLLVVSNPPLAPLLAPLAGVPYTLLLYDLYPDVLEQLGGGEPRSGSLQGLFLTLLSGLWHRANRAVYSRAERVITLSEAMADALQADLDARAPSAARRAAVVPPWADTEAIRPLAPEDNPFRSQQNLGDSFLVLYSGNLGLTHPLEPLLEASADFPPGSELLLIGDGPKRSSLIQLSRNRQLQRVRFLEPLPLAAVSQSYSAADLAVVCLDGPAARASLPSKTFTALATGTPILALAPDDSELAALVKRHRCGVVVPPDAPPARIAAAVAALVADPPRLLSLARQALAASRHYGPENAERLIRLWLDEPAPR